MGFAVDCEAVTFVVVIFRVCRTVTLNLSNDNYVLTARKEYGIQTSKVQWYNVAILCPAIELRCCLYRIQHGLMLYSMLDIIGLLGLKLCNLQVPSRLKECTEVHNLGRCDGDNE